MADFGGAPLLLVNPIIKGHWKASFTSGEAFFISSTQITFIRDGLSYVQQSTEKATLSVAWNSVSEGLAYIWQSKWVGIIAIKTQKTQIHFLSDFLVAVASLDLKVLNEKNKTIVSLCTAAPPLKKIGKERLWFTVDNRVQRPRDFFRNVWKMIWLVISHTSLHHWNSEIWLAFIFAGFAIGAFCTESFTFVRDNNMMWD